MDAPVTDRDWLCRCFECVGDESCCVCGVAAGEVCARGCSEHPANRAPCPNLVEVVERVQIGADGKHDESTRSIEVYDGDHELDRAFDRGEVLGPATSADLLELDAVPEPIDSAAPAATYLPGCAPVGPDAETRPIRAGRTTDDIHARTLARART